MKKESTAKENSNPLLQKTKEKQRDRNRYNRTTEDDDRGMTSRTNRL
jgi:hypothetical protein